MIREIQIAAAMGKHLEGVEFDRAGQCVGLLIAMFMKSLPPTSDAEIDNGIDALAEDAKAWYRKFNAIRKAAN